MTNKLWTIKSRKRFFLIERIKKILSKNKKAEEENLARLEKIVLSAKAEQATRRPKRKRSTRAQQSKPTSVNNAKLPPGFKHIPEKLVKHFPQGPGTSVHRAKWALLGFLWLGTHFCTAKRRGKIQEGNK